MEERFGALGGGAQVLLIRGQPFTLRELMHILGLAFEDNQPIDAHELESGHHYAIRYYDGEDRRIVAYEFNAQFHPLGEMRVHIAEWMGEEEYHTFGWGAWCPWSI